MYAQIKQIRLYIELTPMYLFVKYSKTNTENTLERKGKVHEKTR